MEGIFFGLAAREMIVTIKAETAERNEVQIYFGAALGDMLVDNEAVIAEVTEGQWLNELAEREKCATPCNKLNQFNFFFTDAS